MKIKITITLLLSFLCVTLMAQDCGRYHPFTQGAEFELRHYDKKGKTTSKGIYKVKNVSGDGGVETATMNMELFDKKGESFVSTEYEVTCTDDVVSIDFSNLFSPSVYEAYGEMEFTMSGDNLQIPNNLTVGQSLPDANAVMEVNLKPMTMKTFVNFVNRKVASKENVTTEAGTFECYLVTYETVMKTVMGITKTGSAKQWVTEKLGIIKEESYNGKGKMLGWTELSSYKGIEF